MDKNYASLKCPQIVDLSQYEDNQFFGKLSDAPLLFHGVNKSGSLAFSRSVHAAYVAVGKEKQFLCRYMQMPVGRDEAIAQFKGHLDKAPILIDHAMVGVQDSIAGSRLSTMLRHPVSRFISIYFWLQTKHPEKLMGRDIMSWARQEHRIYSQLRQFTFTFLKPATAIAMDRLPIDDSLEKAITLFETKMAWWGICELFEETLVSFSIHRGFNKVANWETDKRNVERPEYTKLPRNMYEELSMLLGYDVAFYTFMKSEFTKRFMDDELTEAAALVKDIHNK